MVTQLLFFYMTRYHMYLYQGAMVMQKQQTQTHPYREIHLGIFWIRGSKVLRGANRGLGRVFFLCLCVCVFVGMETVIAVSPRNGDCFLLLFVCLCLFLCSFFLLLSLFSFSYGNFNYGDED